jgi:hypothetical protein
MVHPPEVSTPAAPDSAFIYGPADAPQQDETVLPEADLWQALMARWIGPALPEAEPPPEPPADIWW